MKIDQMLVRENFYLILKETLERYYSVVHNTDVVISIKGNSILKDGCVYPKINTITTQFPSKNVRDYIFTEFNARNSFIKYLKGKLYTALCLFTGGLMSKKTLVFEKNKPIDNEILIWPCNRKIRVFDFKKGYVDSIIKESFTDKYFKKEVSFRSNSNYSFVPKISSHGDIWYREQLLIGQPLARITDEKQFEKSRIDTINNMKKIVEDTIKYVVVDIYVEKLYKHINELILDANKRKKITTGETILEAAMVARTKTKLLPTQIPIAVSHGDLQEGNIWVDTKNKKTLIIDWETNDYRSIWYDPATLLLATRSNNGIYNMCLNCKKEETKNAILTNDNNKLYDMEGILGIIILEDIVFHLEDNLELQFDWGKENIDEMGKQLKKIIWE
tara:strand:+ start:15585 stop:16748 length:1164 start_codon:yes stop_codon:yes gene_type:complete